MLKMPRPTPYPGYAGVVNVVVISHSSGGLSKYCPIGASRSTRCWPTSCRIVVATKVLVMLPACCRNCGLTGRPVLTSATPAARFQVRLPSRTSASTPGMPAVGMAANRCCNNRPVSWS